MTRVSAILVAVLLVTAGAGAGINCWSTSGPYGGETLFITVDPQTPNVLFTAVNGGGFFVSRNWGQSWEFIEGYEWPRNVDACLIHPQDHQLVLAGGGSVVGEGIYRSTDGGVTWENLHFTDYMTPSICAFAIHPEQPNVIYAASKGSHGILASADWGKTWSLVAPIPGYTFADFAMLPAPPYSFFYAPRRQYNPDTGETTEFGIIRSTDGGFTWHQSFPPIGSAYRLVCHPDRPGWIYASLSIDNVSHIYRSTDGGDSWDLLLPNISFWGMVFHPTDPDLIYFAGPRCFRSADGGQTYTEIYPVSGRSAALDRSSPDGALYFGTSDGIVRSWDGGGTFKPATFGILDYMWSLAVSPVEPGVVYAGDMKGLVHRSVDDGNSWTSLGRLSWGWVVGLAINASTHPATIFASDSARLFKSTDDGASWSAQTGYAQSIYDIKGDPTDPLRFYASSGYTNTLVGEADRFKGIYATTDGGQTWTATGRLAGINISELLIDPTAPHTIYAAGNGGLYKSADYGASWEPAMGGLVNDHVRALAIDVGPPAVLYAGIRCDEDGQMAGTGVYRSTDAADSWTYCGLLFEEVISLAFDPVTRMLYAGTRYGGLHQSADGGDTWELASPFLATTPEMSDIVTDSRGAHRVYVTTNKGVFSYIGTEEPMVVVEARSTQTGIVNPTLTNQVLPAAAVTLLFANNPFPAASTANPVMLELQLPAGATLGQTLATGQLTDLTIQPAGRTVLPLAVSEYAWDPSPAVHMPRIGGSAGAIPNPAVQLFRCVKGEDRIWLRLLRSTNYWEPSDPECALGVTIGTGAGVWPPTDGSNWGAAGVFRQENTQFFGDIRGYDFAAHDGTLTLTLRAFYQKSGAAAGAVFRPAAVDLFRLDLDWPDTYWTASLLGAVITDWAAADLDGDGREDVVSVDVALGRLYWSLGRPDGTFAPPQWRALAGDAPVTVEAADATGDGRPEILVADAGGHLTVYAWADVADKAAAPEQALAPRQRTVLPGVASASLVHDVTGDGLKDYLYTDAAAGTLTVLPGTAFAVPAIYPAGAHPLALTAGDFDGDADSDIAVANRDGRSVTVFLNAGGAFSGTEYDAAGAPAALAATDFNRDGRADLAVVLADPKAVAVWRAGAGGEFDTGQGQRIYFLNIPSALAADNFDGQNGPDLLVGFADFYKLALCVSDAAGTLGYAYNINTLADTELDPVNHVTLTEDAVLSIAGGTALGGICSRAGVAAVANQSFNLVHFPRSADLAFSVVNLGAAAALLNLELYSDTGGCLAGITQSIEPYRQFARYLNDPSLFGAAANAPDRWVRAFITQPDTYGFWLANPPGRLDYLDGLPLPDARAAASAFVLPGGTDPVRQALFLNPGGEQALVNIQRVGAGTVKETVRRTLPGRGRWVLDLDRDLPDLAAEDFLQVTADRPIVGCELFGDDNKLAAVEALPLPAAPATLRAPHIASGSLGVAYETYLTLVNPGDAPVDMVCRLYGDDGGLLGQSPLVTVPARGQLHREIHEVINLAGAMTGHLTVDYLSAGAVTGWVTFGEAGAGRFLASLPLATGGAADYLVGHIANGTLDAFTFFTGLAVVNPHDASHDVRVTAFDTSGLPIDSTVCVVPPNGRDIFLLDQRLPFLASRFGGYLRIEDLTDPDAELQVFALFGDTPLNFLSAVAAQAVRSQQ
ncbi:MAG TPA: FG-GAP-like repeat-containing protein [Acidobacteriota bacterium]|nr:FG-GAP-like repeat-containing protein [Acidobacteriota bacterium]HQM63992.1 FG-GAP-like repeat-containing protein [Acidobacteriota bacterium]